MTKAKEHMEETNAHSGPIRWKTKRNMTPVRGITTSDSTSNGLSFLTFQVVDIKFLHVVTSHISQNLW